MGADCQPEIPDKDKSGEKRIALQSSEKDETGWRQVQQSLDDPCWRKKKIKTIRKNGPAQNDLQMELSWPTGVYPVNPTVATRLGQGAHGNVDETVLDSNKNPKICEWNQWVNQRVLLSDYSFFCA